MRAWNESEILVDRKSKFQARCCKLENQKDIPRLLQELISEHKSVAKASHIHMYAWQTAELAHTAEITSNSKGSKKKNKKPDDTYRVKVKNIQQGSLDCGEAGAGQRLLTLLERAHLYNVIVIVTRWYGGTPLGNARFRHISTTAVESLKRGNFL